MLEDNQCILDLSKQNCNVHLFKELDSSCSIFVKICGVLRWEEKCVKNKNNDLISKKSNIEFLWGNWNIKKNCLSLSTNCWKEKEASQENNYLLEYFHLKFYGLKKSSFGN